ncbi:PC-esterase domain-containing protein 1A-like isoform X2 [Periplaneta americana]|uniref:PC-esterase domain-containing protein 1A-like isoform X2 n=1 Tax=Periplaneta americana TaxID=6978 RepID=UPI0037E9B84D
MQRSCWLENVCSSLETQLENSFKGDSLTKGSQAHRGREFEEIREYENNSVYVEFCFLTKCYNSVIEDVMSAIQKNKKPSPDVIILNSCLWDICRWGPNGVGEYKDNLVKLMRLLKMSLPANTLVIWTTVPPVSSTCKGGFLIKQVEFLHHTLRFEVMEANMFARQVVVTHGFDVLDIHHHLRMQIHRRAKDGIHWSPLPVRHMTNLILTHIALSWNAPLPGNFESKTLEKLMKVSREEEEEHINSRAPSPSLSIEILEEKILPRQTSVKTKKKVKKSRRKKNRNHIPLTYPAPTQLPLVHQCSGMTIPLSQHLLQYEYQQYTTTYNIFELWERASGRMMMKRPMYTVNNGLVRNRQRQWRSFHPYSCSNYRTQTNRNYI